MHHAPCTMHHAPCTGVKVQLIKDLCPAIPAIPAIPATIFFLTCLCLVLPSSSSPSFPSSSPSPSSDSSLPRLPCRTYGEVDHVLIHPFPPLDPQVGEADEVFVKRTEKLEELLQPPESERERERKANEQMMLQIAMENLNLVILDMFDPWEYRQIVETVRHLAPSLPLPSLPLLSCPVFTRATVSLPPCHLATWPPWFLATLPTLPPSRVPPCYLALLPCHILGELNIKDLPYTCMGEIMFLKSKLICKIISLYTKWMVGATNHY